MRKEVSKAVDIFHKIAFKNLETKKVISESQIRLFISIFTELLLVRYEKYWFPDDPERASGYRCIRVNRQSIDPVVGESLCKAGFPKSKHKQLISHDVTVWVDPGVVSMRIGEDGSVGHEVVDEQLYAKNMAKRGCSPQPRSTEYGDSDVDEGIGSRSPSPPDTPTGSSSNDYSTPSRRPGPLRKSPPPQEYNPYAMSAQVCNAGRRIPLHQAMTPPHPNVLQQPRTMSPPSLYSASPSSAQPPVSRPILPPSSGMMAPPPSSGALYHTSGNIPVSASSHGSPSFPSARRSVFGECGGMVQDTFGKMAARDYHAMAMNYHGNSSSYLDIPVVA